MSNIVSSYPADIPEWGCRGGRLGRQALEEEAGVLLRLTPLAQQAHVHSHQLTAHLWERGMMVSWWGNILLVERIRPDST